MRVKLRAVLSDCVLPLTKVLLWNVILHLGLGVLVDPHLWDMVDVFRLLSEFGVAGPVVVVALEGVFVGGFIEVFGSFRSRVHVADQKIAVALSLVLADQKRSGWKISSGDVVRDRSFRVEEFIDASLLGGLGTIVLFVNPYAPLFQSSFILESLFFDNLLFMWFKHVIVSFSLHYEGFRGVGGLVSLSWLLMDKFDGRKTPWGVFILEPTGPSWLVMEIWVRAPIQIRWCYLWIKPFEQFQCRALIDSFESMGCDLLTLDRIRDDRIRLFVEPKFLLILISLFRVLVLRKVLHALPAPPLFGFFHDPTPLLYLVDKRLHSDLFI